MRTHLLLVFALLSVGCERPSEKIPAARTAPLEAPTPPVERPVASPTVTPPGTPDVRSASGAPSVPFTVRALLGTDDAPRAGLVDTATGRGVSLRRGESYAGFELRAVDFEKESALFVAGGKELWLAVSRKARGPALAETPPSAAGTEAAAADFRAAQPVRYEPNEDEKSVGIDPNNPSSWPQGYRGPGIERAFGDELTETSAVPIAGTNSGQYVSSPSETALGINPNEAGTWPASYRGPGIERALEANPDMARHTGPKLDAAMPPTPR